jgi:hypothetical protein
MKKTHKEETLGTIKILAERQVPYVELDLDIDDNTLNKIAKAGLIAIKRDKKALFNYALTKALEELSGRKSN